MEPNGLNFSTCSRITQSDFNEAKRGNSAPRIGDILFSKDGTVGKVHQVDTEQDFAVLSSIAIIRPNLTKIEPSYLAQFLRSPAAVDAADRSKTGSALRRIILKDIRRLKIPIPPLSEQRRIAAILDQADAVCRKRHEALSRLADLGQAIFYDMFGDPVTNTKRWPIGRIGDLLAEVKYGTAAKANEAGLGMPILRMGNLTYDGQIDLTNLKHVVLPARDIQKYTTKRGDILFNRTNSKDLVGKTAVVSTDVPMAIAGYLIRSRVNAAGNPYYISAYLNSSHGKTVLKNMCKSIVGMANINAKEMQRIPIALPDIALQNLFEQKLMKISQQKTAFENAAKESAMLFNALQQRAFRDDL
jgi:type I restriction enzyme S subunit